MRTRKFNYKEKDQIVNEITKTEDEIIRLKNKLNNEGLSSPEFHTLEMLKKKLRRLKSL